MSDRERGHLSISAPRVLIVADLGLGHEGDFGTAVRQITAAYRAGADAVRLPVYITERCLHPKSSDEFRRWKRCEFRRAELSRLSDLAQELGIEFITSPLDVESIEPAIELSTRFKIGSGDNDFLPLISAMAATGKPILMSTGGSDLDRIARSVDTLISRRALDRLPTALTLMHAVCWAPTPPEAVNLRAIQTLAQHFSLPVGYSDHCLGTDACCIATAVGATVIEKEFSILATGDRNKTQPGESPAQVACLPDAFAAMVERIRQTETWLGHGRKRVHEGERPTLRRQRRSIVAVRELSAGHAIRPEDLTWLRPAIGLPPGCEPLLIGGCLRRAVGKHEPVQLDDVQMLRAA